MTVIQKAGEYRLHVTGDYKPLAKLGSVVFSSTFDNCRFPDEHQRLLSINLTLEELETLVYELNVLGQQFP